VTAPQVRTPGGNRASAEDTKADAAHFASHADDVQRKRFESLRALLAMKGHELHATDGGIYIVRRWGLCRDLRDLAAVEQFAEQVGAL
jgi:hypothetical protein